MPQGIHRGEVRGAGIRFKIDEVTMLAPTIITNAAIEFVGRLERESLTCVQQFDKAESYADIVSVIFFYDPYSEDSEFKKDNIRYVKVTPFKGFIYYPTARTLKKIADQSPVFKFAAYPVPVIPMGFFYTTHYGLLESPQVQKIEEEDRILCQLILDLSLKQDVKDYKKAKKRDNLVDNVISQFEDPLTAAMRSIWKKCQVTTQSVLTARILLDILDILHGYL